MKRLTLPKFRMERVVVSCVLVGAVILLATLALRTEEKKDAVDRANAVADPLIGLCLRGDDTSRVLASSRTTDGKPVCEVAADIKTNPAMAPVPDIDDSRVRVLVRDELSKLPPAQAAQPSMDQLIEAASLVISANQEQFRGEPGAPATPEQIAQVVSLWVTDHPDQFRGEKGDQGVNGRRGPPGVSGKDGTPGAPGASFGGLTFASRSGQCVAVVTIVDVRGSRETTQDVPPVLCGEQAPPTTVTVTPTPEPSLIPLEPPTGG